MSKKTKERIGWLLLHQLATFLIVITFMLKGNPFLYSYGVSFIVSSCMFGVCVLVALITIHFLD